MTTQSSSKTRSLSTTDAEQIGPELTEELHEKTEDNEEITEILEELCDDTLTDAQRLENQFSLTRQWQIGKDLLETRILRVLTTDPRKSSGETDTNPDTETDAGEEKQNTVELTPQQKSILTRLPATTDKIADELEITIKSARLSLIAMQRKGIEIQSDNGDDKFYLDGDAEQILSEMGMGTGGESVRSTDSIYLVYWLPDEGVAVEQFSKPVPWNPDEYKFARLVEEIGYDASALEQLEGEPVVLEQYGEGWQVPDPSKNDIHPGDYSSTSFTSNKDAPSRSTNTVTQRTQTITNRILLNPSTIGAVGFLLGGAIIYTVYAILTLAGPAMLEVMTPDFDGFGIGEETSETDGYDPETQIEIIVEAMFPLLFIMFTLVIVTKVVSTLTHPNRHHK